jgi:ABC-type multidrug transport system permease subunit
VKQAVSQFGEHALPKGVSLVRYTSNPNPFRFFRIIIILAIFFSIATVFVVLLVLLFAMVTGFKHPR